MMEEPRARISRIGNLHEREIGETSETDAKVWGFLRPRIIQFKLEKLKQY